MHCTLTKKDSDQKEAVWSGKVYACKTWVDVRLQGSCGTKRLLLWDGPVVSFSNCPTADCSFLLSSTPNICATNYYPDKVTVSHAFVDKQCFIPSVLTTIDISP